MTTYRQHGQISAISSRTPPIQPNCPYKDREDGPSAEGGRRSMWVRPRDVLLLWVRVEITCTTNYLGNAADYQSLRMGYISSGNKAFRKNTHHSMWNDALSCSFVASSCPGGFVLGSQLGIGDVVFKNVSLSSPPFLGCSGDGPASFVFVWG